MKIKIYLNAVLSLVSCCGTGSIKLRKGQRLRMFLNCVLRNILGPKVEEEKWRKRKVHNE